MSKTYNSCDCWIVHFSAPDLSVEVSVKLGTHDLNIHDAALIAANRFRYRCDEIDSIFKNEWVGQRHRRRMVP